ncbi:MAG: anion transporter, partial [Epsilonproteobacteria bacterium]|nr:anion transporter [Campylobacterota bacterium]
MVEKEPYQIRDLLIALAVGLLFFAGAFTVFSFTQAALVGVIALLVTLWTNEALPLAVTS